MNQLKNKAEQIGSEVVSCSADCQDVSADLLAGILPRCLFFEERSGVTGAVIVGLNPGMSGNNEREFYQEHGATYAMICEFWNENHNKISYYGKMRRLVNALGLDGSIWWTELAKCESAIKGVKPPIQTLRYCGGRFLHRELQAVPKEWPVLAVGRDAFNALIFLLHDRTVLGVPHPTGSWGGQFDKLFDDDELCEVVDWIARECLAAPVAQAKWLSDRC